MADSLRTNVNGKSSISQILLSLPVAVLAAEDSMLSEQENIIVWPLPTHEHSQSELRSLPTFRYTCRTARLQKTMCFLFDIIFCVHLTHLEHNVIT